MSEEKKPNQLEEILKRKQQSQNKGSFNPNTGKNMKPQKGFGGPSVVRRTGRGK